MMRFMVLSFAIPFLALAAQVEAQTPPATSPSTRPAQQVVTPPPKAEFDIYILMGQSNMVGRDVTGMDAQTPNPRLLSLNQDGQWVVAMNPLHYDTRIPPGAGLGMSFAQEMYKANPTRAIGLVPTAVGGTPLSRWVKRGDLYQAAVARAKVAAAAGTIKGVLWHQGESDTNTANTADTYEARLTQMFKDLREDLGAPNLPIVVGQLGEFMTVDKYPRLETVRAALRRMPAALAGVGYADSAGLTDKGDQLHFSTAGVKEFGIRYAKAMQELQKSPPATAPSR